MEQVISKVNDFMRLLQIVAANVAIIPDGFGMEWYGISIWIYDDYDNEGNVIEGTAKAKMANVVKTLRRFTKGTAEKAADDYAFTVKIIPPDGRLWIQVMSSRKSICEKVITGQVEVEQIDYQAAPKKMVMQDVIEWRCDPILDGAL